VIFPLNLDSTLEFAVEIALQAGRAIRDGWGRAACIASKGDFDVVTAYDGQVERMLLGHIQSCFPDHAILSEESGMIGPSTSSFLWIIDPLDGTINFAHGLPAFGVSIALQENGVLQLGVIYLPVYEECFVAQRGGGAALNDEPVTVSKVSSVKQALLATGFGPNRSDQIEKNADHFIRFVSRSQGVRRSGSAAVDLAYTACGRLDGYWEFALPWDLAAGALMVTEAGGRVTGAQGRADFLESPVVVASNGAIHQEMLEILSEGCR
jgi:myo-inositol-1(or 4)-monophosphatase